MAKDKLTFEQAMAKLEQIVAAIESGKVGLEESIEKYVEGMRLHNYCQGLVNAAEKKIQLLTARANGTLEPGGELPESTDQPQT